MILGPYARIIEVVETLQEILISIRKFPCASGALPGGRREIIRHETSRRGFAVVYRADLTGLESGDSFRLDASFAGKIWVGDMVWAERTTS